MRNVTFVFKQLQRRIAAYYGQYFDTLFIREGLTKITKIHNVFHRHYDATYIPFLRYREMFYRLSEIEMKMLKIYKERFSEKKELIYANAEGYTQNVTVRKKVIQSKRSWFERANHGKI